MAKTKAPIAMARERPRLSDNAPANNDATVADSMIEEITRPCIEGERAPKVRVKEGMTVTGPIAPLSRLDRDGDKISRVE